MHKREYDSKINLAYVPNSDLEKLHYHTTNDSNQISHGKLVFEEVFFVTRAMVKMGQMFGNTQLVLYDFAKRNAPFKREDLQEGFALKTILLYQKGLKALQPALSQKEAERLTIDKTIEYILKKKNENFN